MQHISKNRIGVDNDELCLINSRENVLLNNPQNIIKIKLAEITQILETNFDLITANINKNEQIQITENLKTRIKFLSILFLSGIYKKDIQETETIFSKYGFRKIEHQSID